MTTRLNLGKIGIWTWTLDAQPMPAAREAVQELEELGFNTVWIPEAVGREPFAHAGILLSATKNLILATGIASMYARTAATMQAGQKTLTSAFPERFLLGIGASHGHMVKSLHKTAYVKPYSSLVGYCLAGLVSHCDEKVVHRVGYVLGVGVRLPFVCEHGGRGSVLGLGGKD